MPYLISLIVAVVAVLLLAVQLIRQAARVRRLAAILQVVRAHFADRLGLLKARVAALKTELNRWRRARPSRGSGGSSAA